MNTHEERILHGLYYHRQIVGEEISFTAGELNWIANASLQDGKKWLKDGRLQSLESKADDYLLSISTTSAAAERPLAYLKAAGCITYTKNSGWFRIAVTGTGADIARNLDTFWGRANLRYKQHRDGVLWFILAAFVSLVIWLVK